MSSFKNVALVGASGNVGRHILPALNENGFNVAVISRLTSTATFDDLPAQNVIKGEYTPAFFQKALTGQDASVMAVGFEGFELQKQIVEAAIEVGVKRIVPSEFGSDLDNPASLDALPFNRAKKAVADQMVEVLESHPQTTWTAIVSGHFFDWCLENNHFDFNVKNHEATLYDEEKHQNERVYISGINTTQAAILEALKKARGVQDWKVNYRSAKALQDEGWRKLSQNDYSGVVNLVKASGFLDGMGANYSAIRILENEQLGVKDDLLATLRKYVDSL